MTLEDPVIAGLHDRWEALSSRVGAFASSEQAEMTFEMVWSMYAHPPRAYHSLEHIADCLDVYDRVLLLAEERDALEFSIWLHDCIFFPERHDNEARSADAAGMIAGLLGCAPPFIEKVRELVMVTKHDSCPVGGDAALISDIDLAILAAPAERYDRYRLQVREEFAFAPDDMFYAGRRVVLERLLDRSFVYATPYVRSELEEAAQQNLERELDAVLGYLEAG